MPPVFAVAVPAPSPLTLVVIVIIAAAPVGSRSHDNRAGYIDRPGFHINRLGRDIYRSGGNIDRCRFRIDDTGNAYADIDVDMCACSRCVCEKCAAKHRKHCKLLHLFLHPGRLQLY